MTITSLSPLQPAPLSAAEGNMNESRSDGMTEAPPPVMQQVTTPSEVPPQTQGVRRSDLFQSSQGVAARRFPPVDLMDVSAQAQVAIRAFGTQVRFAVDKESHQVIVQVYDVETKEVIREIPPEQIIKVMSKIMEAHDAKGLWLDEQV